MAVGSVVARLFSRPTPVEAVGTAVIDRTPPGVKHWAIQTFGHNDKAALRVGIALLLLLAAAAIGVDARHRKAPAAAGVAAFGLIGAVAGVTRHASGLSAAWASLLGAVAALLVLRWLLWVPEPAGDASHLAAPRDAGRAEDRGHEVLSWPTRSRASGHFERRRFLGRSAATIGLVALAGAAATREGNDDTKAALATAPDRLPTPTQGGVTIPAGSTLDPVAPYVTPADDFYRIDTAFTYPRVRADRWKLTVRGMVDNPLTITYADLLALPQVERAITLTCVSNEVGGDLIGNAVWQGVLLRDVLARAKPRPGAEQVATTSVDGFTAGFPLEVATDPARDSLIAVGMNGRALPLPHGFPARLVVPGLYGYVSATKWLSAISLTTWDDFDGYWVGQGWAKRAPIKTGSRIDVPRSGAEVTAGPVVVAGVAWAQHRGISRVEVRVDDGRWTAATLGAVVGSDTWRQWRFEWDALPGDHTLRVRATDGSGATQTGVEAPPAPDGATGHHSRRVRVHEA